MFILINVYFNTVCIQSIVDPLEYCETELFHAECKDNEVVIIENAQYGRMRFGRCVERDYGIHCLSNQYD